MSAPCAPSEPDVSFSNLSSVVFGGPTHTDRPGGRGDATVTFSGRCPLKELVRAAEPSTVAGHREQAGGNAPLRGRGCFATATHSVAGPTLHPSASDERRKT